MNAPHPDEANPEDFFGDGPDAAEERSLMPDEGDENAAEEAAEEPVAEGDADEPNEEEQPAASERAPAPASGVALPGQQLSEDGEEQAEVGPDGEKVELPPASEDGPGPTDALGDGEQPAPSAGAEQQPQPAAGGEGEPPAETASAPPKNAPRGYVVVREVALTRDFLGFCVKALEEGKDPFTVYMVLEPKVEARNPAPVLTAAFKKHHKRLGPVLRLAAIPLSMWKVKTLSLKPKVIDDNIAIED